ncbi:MAG: heavy-metal-associated domain-containing protein [Desulfovibrionales bacterium]|nr:heavy-metal-associated domain-containing protein [Desulfovibrionales bacterium]
MAVLKISGMSCNHCTGSVSKLLQSMPGISNVQVSLDPGQAEFDAADTVDMNSVREAIRKIGFEPEQA